MSFRVAHNIVGKTVSNAIEGGKSATDLTVAMLDDSCRELFGHPLDLSANAMSRALDPWANIEVRKVTGGPAPDEMARMLRNANDRQNTAEARQGQRRTTILAAEGRLDREVSAR